MAALWRRIEHLQGKIEVPFLGARVGEFKGTGTLTRRGDEGPEAAFYDFHAVLSFVNQAIFDDAEYPKVVTVQLGKGRAYRLEPVPGPAQRTALSGRSLVMERVRMVCAD